MKKMRKSIALLLAFVMYLSMVQVVALADGGGPEGEAEITEHTHNEGGWSCVYTVDCNQPEHTHGEDCYELVCEEAHTEHNADCFAVCELEEHEHTPDCYGEFTRICGFEEHQHDDDCYSVSEESEESVLVCELAEHTHSDSCCGAPEAICGKDAHTHSDACQGLTSNCPGLHVHGEGCYELTCETEEHNHAEAGEAGKWECIPPAEDPGEEPDEGGETEEPGEPEEVTISECTLTDAESGVSVKGNLPEGGSVEVIEKTEEDGVIVAYEIKILTTGGNEYQPEDDIEVTIPVSKDDGTVVKVYNGSTLIAEPTVTDEAVTFTTKYFSEYTVKDKVIGEFSKLNFTANVTLDRDYEATTGVTISQNITLDLNGHTISFTGTDSLFTVESGKIFTIKDSATTGTLRGNESGTAALILVNGTLNLEGSTITGHHNKGNGQGGAIKVDNGTLNFTGGTITDNHSDTGDETYSSSYGGGAIYSWSGKINIGQENADNSLVQITGNTAKRWGGGILLKGSSQLDMKSGTISNNTAFYAEGGGIAMVQYESNEDPTGIITGGIISGNETKTQQDWGGGGIFIADGSSLTIKNAYITGNHADGYGGGVTACPTGHVTTCNVDGAAIFGNTAKGTVLAGSGSTKHNDQITKLAQNAGKFLYFNDFYSAKASSISAYMMGGGDANWIGMLVQVAGETYGNVRDIELSGTQRIATLEQVGLNARPSDAAKASAEAVAKVFIQGNSSTTHAGGILCNGVLTLGSEVENDAYTPLTLTLKKEMAWNGASTPVPQLVAGAYTFELTLPDGTTKTAVNDADGNINFFLSTQELGMTNNSVGNDPIELTVKEIKGTDPSITYDSTVYNVELTVKVETATVKVGANTITTHTLKAKTQAWSKGTPDEAGKVAWTNLKAGETPTFTNVKQFSGKLTIRKAIQVDKGEFDGKSGFGFEITGPEGFSGTITVKAGETVDVDVPYAGDYTVTETTPCDTPLYKWVSISYGSGEVTDRSATVNVSVEKPEITVTATNKYQIRTAEYSVEKEWLGYSDEDVAKKSVEVMLQKLDNGRFVDCGEAVTLPIDGKWSYTWENLPYGGTYRVRELTAKDRDWYVNYEFGTEKTTIQNIYLPLSTSVEVVKKWNGYGSNPDVPVQMQLFQLVNDEEVPVNGAPIHEVSSGTNWSASWEDLDYGQYIVREIGKPVSWKVSYGEPANEKSKTTFTIVNTFLGEGSLEISKAVTGSGNKTADWHFTIQLSVPVDETGEEKFTLPTSYPCTINKEESNALTLTENNTLTITLKDGETAVISGILVGTEYTVTETEANLRLNDGRSYTTSVMVQGEAVETASGRIQEAGYEGVIEFTNDLPAPTPNPGPNPDPTPDPDPDPDPDPTPTPTPEEPEVVIPEEPTPLTPEPEVPEEPEIEIDEDPTPMTRVPETGDNSAFWMALAVLSLLGLAALVITDKKSRSTK